MGHKRVISSLEDFRAHEGELPFSSASLIASKDRIQEFCRSVNQHANDEEQPVTLGNFIVRYWPE